MFGNEKLEKSPDLSKLESQCAAMESFGYIKISLYAISGLRSGCPVAFRLGKQQRSFTQLFRAVSIASLALAKSR